MFVLVLQQCHRESEERWKRLSRQVTDILLPALARQQVYVHAVSTYRKNSILWDTSNNCHNCPKNRKVWCNIALMHPKDADGMANSIDPDQTASSEAVWSWSALFAETYLSQYIEFELLFLIFMNLELGKLNLGNIYIWPQDKLQSDICPATTQEIIIFILMYWYIFFLSFCAIFQKGTAFMISLCFLRVWNPSKMKSAL